MNRFAWLFFIVLLVAALWSAGWYAVRGQVEGEIARLASAEGTVENPRLTCSSSSVGGFPFRIDVACNDAALVADDLTLSVAGLRAAVQVDNPAHMIISLKAPLTRTDAFYGTSTRLSFTSLEASARLTPADLLQGFSGEGWRIARISVVADGLDWVDTIGAEMPLGKARHAELQIGDIAELHDPEAGTAALAVYAVAEGVQSPVYEIADGKAEVQLQVSGLPDDIRRFGDADMLAAWSAAGGKVDLVRANATDGDKLLEISGTLGIDANRMPTGEVAYTSRGVRERLEPFVNAMLLSLLAGVPQDDGTFRQALQFANGNVLVGGLPLVQLAPLY